MKHAMKGARRAGVARLVVALVLASCSADPVPPATCLPGASVACACTSGASGAQVCGADRVLGACVCGDAGGAVDVQFADAGGAEDRSTVPPPDGCTSSTPGNCCGVACAASNGVPACVGGACAVASCNAGFGDCDGVATNGCECHPAHASGACAAGACAVGACEAGWGNCDGNAANGCETDTRTSAAHCGACGAPCAAGRACMAGACDACDMDGDGVAARSCGGMDCNDTDRDSNPTAPERCDGFDNDCDGRDDELITGTFTPDCARLVDEAYPATRNTSPAVCDRVPSAGRPAGTERFGLVCRRQVIVGAAARCYCVAANATRWECGCN
jgi:hypothetical protein